MVTAMSLGATGVTDGTALAMISLKIMPFDLLTLPGDHTLHACDYPDFSF